MWIFLLLIMGTLSCEGQTVLSAVSPTVQSHTAGDQTFLFDTWSKGDDISIVLDPSLWKMPLGATYCMRRHDVPLFVITRGDGALVVEALIKDDVHLHAGPPHILGTGPLRWYGAGNLHIYGGTFEAPLTAASQRIFWHDEAGLSPVFRSGSFFHAGRLTNEATLDQRDLRLSIKAWFFENKNLFKVEEAHLGIHEGWNEGQMMANKSFFIGRGKGFETFHNKGHIMAKNHLVLRGKTWDQAPEGRVFAGCFLDATLSSPQVLHGHFLAGLRLSLGAPEAILDDTWVRTTWALLQVPFLKATPRARLESEEGIVMESPKGFFSEAAVRIANTARTSFPFGLFYGDGDDKRTKHLASHVKKVAASFPSPLPSGFYIRTNEGVLRGDIALPSGSLFAKGISKVPGTLRKMLSPHQEVNITSQLLEFTGAIEASHVKLKADHGILRGDLSAVENLWIEGECFDLDTPFGGHHFMSHVNELNVNQPITSKKVIFDNQASFIKHFVRADLLEIHKGLLRILKSGALETARLEVKGAAVVVKGRAAAKETKGTFASLMVHRPVTLGKTEASAQEVTVYKGGTLSLEGALHAAQMILYDNLGPGRFSTGHLMVSLPAFDVSPLTHLTSAHSDVSTTNAIIRGYLQSDQLNWYVSTTSVTGRLIAHEMRGFGDTLFFDIKTRGSHMQHASFQGQSGLFSGYLDFDIFDWEEGDWTLTSLSQLRAHHVLLQGKRARINGDVQADQFVVRNQELHIGKTGILVAQDALFRTGMVELDGMAQTQDAWAQGNGTVRGTWRFDHLTWQNGSLLTCPGSHLVGKNLSLLDRAATMAGITDVRYLFSSCPSFVLDGPTYLQHGLIESSSTRISDRLFFHTLGWIGTFFHTTPSSHIQGGLLTAKGHSGFFHGKADLEDLDVQMQTLRMGPSSKTHVARSANMKTQDGELDGVFFANSLNLEVDTGGIGGTLEAREGMDLAMNHLTRLHQVKCQGPVHVKTPFLTPHALHQWDRQALSQLELAFDHHLAMQGIRLAHDITLSSPQLSMSGILTSRANLTLKSTQGPLFVSHGHISAQNLRVLSSADVTVHQSTLSALQDLTMAAQGRGLLHDSHLFAGRDALLVANQGWNFTPRITHHSEETVKRRWFKKVVTRREWDEVHPSRIVAGGTLQIMAPEGGITSLVADLVGGHVVMGARDDISVLDVVTHERTSRKSRSLGGLVQSKTSSFHEMSNPTMVAANERIHGKSFQGAIRSRGGVWMAPFLHLEGYAGIHMGMSTLRHEISHETCKWGIGSSMTRLYDVGAASSGREALKRLSVLTRKIAEWQEASNTFNQVSGIFGTTIAMQNTIHDIHNGQGLGHFIGVSDPSFEVMWSRRRSHLCQTSPGQGGLFAQHIKLESQDNVRLSEALPVYAQHLEVRGNSFIQEGFPHTFLQSQDRLSMGLSGSAKGGHLRAGYQGSSQSHTVWESQGLHVGILSLDVREHRVLVGEDTHEAHLFGIDLGLPLFGAVLPSVCLQTQDFGVSFEEGSAFHTVGLRFGDKKIDLPLARAQVLPPEFPKEMALPLPVVKTLRREGHVPKPLISYETRGEDAQRIIIREQSEIPQLSRDGKMTSDEYNGDVGPLGMCTRDPDFDWIDFSARYAPQGTLRTLFMYKVHPFIEETGEEIMDTVEDAFHGLLPISDALKRNFRSDPTASSSWKSNMFSLSIKKIVKEYSDDILDAGETGLVWLGMDEVDARIIRYAVEDSSKVYVMAQALVRANKTQMVLFKKAFDHFFPKTNIIPMVRTAEGAFEDAGFWAQTWERVRQPFVKTGVPQDITPQAPSIKRLLPFEKRILLEDKNFL